MPSVEGLKRRIAVTQDLESVVRSMKALSAAATKQYDNAASALAEYYQTVETGLHVALKDHRVSSAIAAGEHRGRVGILVFGSDQGLCGRFNEVVADYTCGALNNIEAARENLHILAVGGRVKESLQAKGLATRTCLLVPSTVQGITSSVEDVLLNIDAWRSQWGIESVLAFYNAPLPAGLHRPRMLRLLPLELARFRRRNLHHWTTRSPPSFTMERNALVSVLLRQYLFVSLFRVYAVSLASEHASRQHAMQRAQKNIDEHLEELRGLYQQERQNAITIEMLDIVNGFEASSTPNDHHAG